VKKTTDYSHNWCLLLDVLKSVLCSRHWLSSTIRSEKKTHIALNEIKCEARRYEDAGSPRLVRNRKSHLFSFEIPFFRPDWHHFAILVLSFAIAGGVCTWAGSGFDSPAGIDKALRTLVSIFVLGISLVNLTRSLSEAGRFTGEYLNAACRMPLFCSLTFLAAFMAFIGWFMTTISWFPAISTSFVAAASVGAAIACLAMLAFVVRETVVCLMPSESVRVVSQFAAAKLCYGYLKEVYVGLSKLKHKDSLEEWCKQDFKAIHPPSEYYGYYFRSHHSPDETEKNCKIPLGKSTFNVETYKDYHYQKLANLDRYLVRNGAELFLSAPEYDSEQGNLGILTSPDMDNKKDLQATIEKMGGQAVRFRRFDFEEVSEDFWDSQESALTEAVKRALDKADPVQLRAYLDAVNKPLTVLRQVRRHRVVRDTHGEYVRRGHSFLRLYIIVLREILDRQSGQNYAQAFAMARVLLKSIWEETAIILKEMDYHGMALFTGLALQIYSVIWAAGDKAGSLQEMRAQFGGFYTFAEDWLEDAEAEDTQEVEKMRMVLYEGLTKWLLMVLERPEESELVRQLCDAGREIAFGRKGEITFDRGNLVAQHFVLSGYLMSRVKAGDVDVSELERLFCERHAYCPDVDFDALITFYLSNPFPFQTLDCYLHIFYKPTQKTSNPLTGSSHSSGCGMTGQHEIALAFIYLAASALTKNAEEPKAIPEDMSFNLNDEAMETVAELFKHTGLKHGLDRLKEWRSRSKALHDEAEAKEIADAALNGQKVEEWKKDFWERYSTSLPVLSLCLKNGNYQIDEDTRTADVRYKLSKLAVIDWKHSIIGAGGDEYGRSLGRNGHDQLLDKLSKRPGKPSQVKGSLSDTMGRAVAWLENKRCNNEAGVIIVKAQHSPESELYNDEDFVPSWREDVRSLGFNGFYRGFPIVWHRTDVEGGDSSQATSEHQSKKIVAVDLKGWKGIKVRKSVVSEGKFGELTIRTWTEEEVQEAVDSKKLELNDVDKAKGYCLVDISLHWELSSCKPPKMKIYAIV